MYAYIVHMYKSTVHLCELAKKFKIYVIYSKGTLSVWTNDNLNIEFCRIVCGSVISQLFWR